MMEKALKFTLLLTLKEMALRKVAVLLWNLPDILVAISKFRLIECSRDERKEWYYTIDNKVKNKVYKLGLPASLVKQTIEVVQPIGKEIIKWKLFHHKHVSTFAESSPDFSKITWTTAGTVDHRNTAKELVHCDDLNVKLRYEMASFYFLEDYIPIIWEELPEEEKEIYVDDDNLFSGLQYCWPHIYKGELSKLTHWLQTSVANPITFHQHAFESSAIIGNIATADYFFQKLTHAERETSLMRTAPGVLGSLGFDYSDPEGYAEEKLTEVLCFLLSLMTPERQMEMLKAEPIDVFLCFLDWPRQVLFLENAELIWTYIPPSRYGDLLWKMADRFGNSDHYFPKIFQEFFMQSPLGLKKGFVHHQSERGAFPAWDFLYLFFGFKDSDSMEVVFRNMDAADRVRLVFHHRAFVSFYKAIILNRWRIVEACIRAATLSKEDRVRLKKVFVLELDATILSECERPKFKRLFDFLEETDASPDIEKKV